MSRDRSCTWEIIHNKICLISLRCPRPSVALQVQSRGLKYHLWIPFLLLPPLCMSALQFLSWMSWWLHFVGRAITLVFIENGKHDKNFSNLWLICSIGVQSKHAWCLSNRVPVVFVSHFIYSLSRLNIGVHLSHLSICPFINPPVPRTVVKLCAIKDKLFLYSCWSRNLFCI